MELEIRKYHKREMRRPMSYFMLYQKVEDMQRALQKLEKEKSKQQAKWQQKLEDQGDEICILKEMRESVK